MKYMIAHGSSPGPTQRPWLAGLITGGLAIVLPLWILFESGASTMLAKNLGLGVTWLETAIAAVAVLAGGVYSRIFGRAINDRRGGWLYGISFGFLVWVIGPTVLLQWIRGEPLVIGTAASSTFVAHLVWGLLLGVLLPYVQQIVARRSIPDFAAILYGRSAHQHDHAKKIA